MNTTSDLWSFSLITNDLLRCGPCFTMYTQTHKVEVYKAREDALYHLCITQLKAPHKRVYESRYDPFYHATSNPRIAQEVARAKLGRFTL